MDETNKKLAFAIVDFFQSIIKKDSHSISNDEKESLEVAIQCIQDVFKISVDDSKQKNLLGSEDANLKSIFEVYLKARKSKKPSSTSPSPATENVSQAQKKKAEELKLKGNQLVTQQNFAEAIGMYTQAIELDPFNPVYLSNRSAAQSQLNRHDLAVEDAKLALKLDPNFSKAYSRMGHAYYQLGQYEASVEAYTTGLELDPNNATMQQALAQAKKKFPTTTNRDPSAMLNQPGFMEMAQQMLQNNPNLASMAQQFLGSGGGEASEGSGPDMSEMMSQPGFQHMAQQAMSDPNFMQNIQNLFGGTGGPSTGPSRGPKKRSS